MNFCVLNGYLESNPTLPKLKLVRERFEPIVPPLESDIAKLIARAPPLTRAAMVTGCRLDELITAHHTQIDHERKQLIIYTAKGNKMRTISLEPLDGYAVFEPLRSTPLFAYDDGQTHSDAAARFRKICTCLAKKDSKFRGFRFHDWRHYHAVASLKSGRSIYDLQQRLGHESMQTTERYLPTHLERRARPVA
jgi:integrase/recombinase XerD